VSYVSVATSFTNAFNQIQAGRYAEKQAELMAGQQEYLAQVEQENALKTAEIIRRAGRRQVGQANAAYAASGVVVGEGSAGEVEGHIRQDVEHDAFQALLEGNRRGRGMQVGAAMLRLDGSMRATAGYVNAAGTALGGTYQGMRANGWRTAGPGFSGTQAPAPVETREPTIYR
jgi:hypothetical protein